MADSNVVDLGVNLLEEEIDEVIFSTNQFLTNSTNVGPSGAFWWILQMCMALAALFCIIFAAGIAFKMMTKNEPLDVMKLFRPLAIAIILCFWYPPSKTGVNVGAASSTSWCVLDFFAIIPNAIGSYTKDLYDSEAVNIEDKFEQMQQLLYERDTLYQYYYGEAKTLEAGLSSPETVSAGAAVTGTDDANDMVNMAMKMWFQNMSAGVIIGFDKLILFISLLVYRIGWWSTIYGQQILLGMLTIFGPLQWAFSILPKWEGSWAKWITRYLTVHFYGAALYFVGFYVLLLFDIVLSIQIENLSAIVSTTATMQAYIKNAFISSGYMMVASVVSLKCLNFVPDLAAWMIPEGETAFSTRQFGEGVASQVSMTTRSVAGKLM